MYRCEHFDLRELVPPEVFEARGLSAWELLDPGALVTLDALRKHFGPISVNTWHVGGIRTESGFRLPTTSTGAVYSQHKYGRAFDCHFRDVTPIEAFDYVRANPESFPHVTALEDVRYTTTWMHFDVRNHQRPGIRVVIP